MPSRYLAAPFILLLLIFGACAFLLDDGSYAFWMIPNIVILAIIYALHPQIDWMWFKNHPPAMDPRLESYVQRLSKFYRSQDKFGQQKFRDRVQLYMLANEFLLRGPEENKEAPDDLKALFAIPVVEMTFDQDENWRLQKFERLIFYPTSFPSPQNHDLHAGEIETEDGVMIIALDLAKQWIDRPEKTFPLIHYIVAQAYLWSFMEKRKPEDPSWSEIENTTGLSQEKIIKIIGLEDVDLQALALAYKTNRA